MIDEKIRYEIFLLKLYCSKISSKSMINNKHTFP